MLHLTSTAAQQVHSSASEAAIVLVIDKCTDKKLENPASELVADPIRSQRMVIPQSLRTLLAGFWS